jgi:hypothetical protein
VGKLLPFVVPLSEAKLAEIKFAEDLLASETAMQKTSVATPQETFEFAIIRSSGEIFAACLIRDTKGKIVDGFVRRFTEPEGLNWYQQMQKRTL